MNPVYLRGCYAEFRNGLRERRTDDVRVKIQSLKFEPMFYEFGDQKRFLKWDRVFLILRTRS